MQKVLEKSFELEITCRLHDSCNTQYDGICYPCKIQYIGRYYEKYFTNLDCHHIIQFPSFCSDKEVKFHVSMEKWF